MASQTVTEAGSWLRACVRHLSASPGSPDSRYRRPSAAQVAAAFGPSCRERARAYSHSAGSLAQVPSAAQRVGEAGSRRSAPAVPRLLRWLQVCAIAAGSRLEHTVCKQPLPCAAQAGAPLLILTAKTSAACCPLAAAAQWGMQGRIYAACCAASPAGCQAAQLGSSQLEHAEGKPALPKELRIAVDSSVTSFHCHRQLDAVMQL